MLVFTTLLAAILFTAACGTHLSDEERAAYAAGALGEAADVGSSVGPAATRNGSGSTTTVPGSTQSAPGSEAGATDPAAADEAVAETGAAAPAAGSGPSCADTAVGAPGVTTDVIRVAGVFQLSGAVPGFAQTAADGANAYANYVNATGGICGRAFEYLIADDAFDGSKHASEIRRLEPEVLAFAAGYSVVDAGGFETVKSTGVPDVGGSTHAPRAALPNHFSHALGPVKGFDVPLPEHTWLKQQGAKKVAIVYAGVAAARDAIQFIYKPSLQMAGLEIVLEQEASSTQFSYAAPARAVKDSGADAMVFMHEITANVAMADELRKVGADLPFANYITGYTPVFPEQAGEGAEGALAFINTLPLDEGGNEELATYRDWLARSTPGARPSIESANAWLHMKVVVDTIRRIDGDVTRESFLAAIKTLNDWDGGGMISPMDVGNRQQGYCTVAVRVVDGKWVRDPASPGFLCR